MFDVNDWANLRVWSEYIIPAIIIAGMVLFVLVGSLFAKIKRFIKNLKKDRLL